MQKSRLRRFVQSMPIAAFVVAAAACGGSEPAQPAAEAPVAAPAPTPAAPASRVFFVEPQDGATVKSPVKARFGLEGYELAPVPEGTITADQVRPGMGHHHLGIDMDCLPAGTEIVKGTPSWVHFGTGATEIDVQLEPGTHKLTLQLGLFGRTRSHTGQGRGQRGYLVRQRRALTLQALRFRFS
jgi:hypothetical protein